MHKAGGPPQQRPTLIRTIDVLRLLGFGWYFASCIGIGIGGGLALDAWLDTKPGFLLGGILLGTAAGFYGLFRMLMPLYRPRDGGNTRPPGESR
jgi:F0F1-type ATP synthase assembly protein I